LPRKGEKMDDFNYGKAEADLYDSGCPYSEEIYEYSTDKGRDEFLRENGLDPAKYHSGSGNSNNSSSNSGCYLTTACVMSKGLPDNCEELETLRSFRDTYLKGIPEGLTDIKEYYEIAPKIVEAINKFPDAAKLWENVYKELILPCVSLIKKGDNKQTYSMYKQYTNMLKDKYLK